MRRAWRSWLFGLILLAGLLAVILNVAELRNFGRLLRAAQPLWLVAALALQLSTYALVATSWAVVLRTAGTPRALRTLVPLSISKLFADQAVPTAGMSGNVLLVDQLMATGVPRGHAVAALLVSMTGYYASYAVLAVIVLALLWLHRAATPLLAGAVTVLLLVAFAIPGLALWLRQRGAGRIPPGLMKIGVIRRLLAIVGQAPGHLVFNRALLLKAAILNGLVFLADAATLQVALLAVGTTVHFNTALIALVMASIAVTLGPIPLGLGSFEAVCIAMLRLLDVALEPALAATLLLRGFTLWLPLIPGLVLTRRLLKRRRARVSNRRAHPFTKRERIN